MLTLTKSVYYTASKILNILKCIIYNYQVGIRHLKLMFIINDF